MNMFLKIEAKMKLSSQGRYFWLAGWSKRPGRLFHRHFWGFRPVFGPFPKLALPDCFLFPYLFLWAIFGCYGAFFQICWIVTQSIKTFSMPVTEVEYPALTFCRPNLDAGVYTRAVFNNLHFVEECHGCPSQKGVKLRISVWPKSKFSFCTSCNQILG